MSSINNFPSTSKNVEVAQSAFRPGRKRKAPIGCPCCSEKAVHSVASNAIAHPQQKTAITVYEDHHIVIRMVPQKKPPEVEEQPRSAFALLDDILRDIDGSV